MDDLNRCVNCKFWDESRTKGREIRIGYCRVGGPSKSKTGDMWPKTKAHDWCGRFQLAQDRALESRKS